MKPHLGLEDAALRAGLGPLAARGVVARGGAGSGPTSLGCAAAFLAVDVANRLNIPCLVLSVEPRGRRLDERRATSVLCQDLAKRRLDGLVAPGFGGKHAAVLRLAHGGAGLGHEPAR